MTASTISAAALALLAAIAPTTPATEAPSTRCTASDPRLHELSGLAETPTGYVAINDGNDDPSLTRIYYLDRRCAIVRSVGYPTPPRDPEDLAIDSSGGLWVADTGDDLLAPTHRSTVALWRLEPDGTRPTLYRLRYPDGPHDAEALVVTADGLPVIITKEPSGAAGVYVPGGDLVAGDKDGVALTLAGQFTPQATGTANPLGAMGNNMVTGAAFASDGRHVVVRTYSDAYEFEAPNGDVVKALTTGTPTVTALPGEPQGEAIAYSRKGTVFLTASDVEEPSKVLAYAVAPRPQPTGTPAAAAAADHRGGLSWIWVAVAVVTGVLGLGAVVAGIAGLRRARRADATASQ
jgi:hypothetical protein